MVIVDIESGYAEMNVSNSIGNGMSLGSFDKCGNEVLGRLSMMLGGFVHGDAATEVHNRNKSFIYCNYVFYFIHPPDRPTSHLKTYRKLPVSFQVLVA